MIGLFFSCVYERDIVSYSLFTRITIYEAKRFNGRINRRQKILFIKGDYI